MCLLRLRLQYIEKKTITLYIYICSINHILKVSEAQIKWKNIRACNPKVELPMHITPVPYSFKYCILAVICAALI